jgi:integrating conjugative element protein (TIGR03756 family)
MMRHCLFLLLFLTTTVKASDINSLTITKSTLRALPNCLHYKVPIHFCLWIDELGSVNTTPVLDHYLPDFVVSVFNKPNENPWLEINKIVDPIGKPIEQAIVRGVTHLDAGNGNHSFQNEYEQTVISKEADVIGNPALLVLPRHGLLRSTAKPLRPYYQSMMDSLLWRGLPPAALPEEAMALGVNVMHHVGNGITNWGGIYPHEGKVMADNDAKGSAVIAARAVDLLTNKKVFGHVKKNVSTSCGENCNAASIQENSKETYFQMIYPIEQDDCHILGNSGSYESKMLNREGAYVWIVWRHYEGCADGDGKYIGRI